MAIIDKFIPILLRWEASTTVKSGESLEAAFNRAKKTGWSNDPADTGGATMVGVTLNTYKAYCTKKGLPSPTVNDLKNIQYSVWKDIVYTMYWNKVCGDQIMDQTVANMIADWVWHSGVGMIKKIQGLVGATQDGSVGPKTITAINSADGLKKKLYDARKQFFDGIVSRNPSQKKWLTGWMNRLNSVYNS